MSIEGNRAKSYLETLSRLEPNLTLVDLITAVTSAAISLKKLSDTYEKMFEEQKKIYAIMTEQHEHFRLQQKILKNYESMNNLTTAQKGH